MAGEPRVRTREAQIERLERRLDAIPKDTQFQFAVAGVMRGILDVLKDDAREAAEGSTS
jgi:hypothetical protein